MAYNPRRHNRHSTRKKGYDYTRAGSYFLTANVQDREHLLSQIVNAEVKLSRAGRIVYSAIRHIPHHFRRARIDAFVVMPDHIHLLLTLRGKRRGRRRNPKTVLPPGGSYISLMPPEEIGPAYGFTIASLEQSGIYPDGRPKGTVPGSIGAIMQNLQSITARKINRWRRTPGVRVWQRNYHDQIIQNARHWHAVRNYIHRNPAQWEADRRGAG